MDMRRSGVVEACRRTNAVGLSAKLANSIGRSNALHKADAPVDIEAVRNTDVARLHGRRKMREANGKGGKSLNFAPNRSLNWRGETCPSG